MHVVMDLCLMVEHARLRCCVGGLDRRHVKHQPIAVLLQRDPHRKHRWSGGGPAWSGCRAGPPPRWPLSLIARYRPISSRCRGDVRGAQSAVVLAKSFLYAVAFSGTISAAALSIDAVGSCGENVAYSSATVLEAAPPGPCRPCRSAVGHRPVLVGHHHGCHQRRRGEPDHRQPQTGPVVVGAQGHPVPARQHEVHDHALRNQQAQHREHRHPPLRPLSTTPIIASPATAASGASRSKASTRQMFLIGSTPAAKPAACPRPRRHRHAGSSARSAVCRGVVADRRRDDQHRVGATATGRWQPGRRRLPAGCRGCGAATRSRPSRSGPCCATAASAPLAERLHRPSKSLFSSPTVPSRSLARLLRRCPCSC